MSESTTWTELRRRAAVRVDEVLKGAQRADLPVESARLHDPAVGAGAGGCADSMIEATRPVGRTLVTRERPASQLALAHAALVAAEQAETAERAKLADLLERERRTLYALEQTAAAIRTAKDWQGVEAARTRAGDLEQERECLIRGRRDQEEALKAARSRRLEAQIAVEEMRQHAGRLERAVLQAEQGVVARQRSIDEAEADLARRADELARQRVALANAQAALNGLRRDLAAVGDPSTDGARP